MKTSNMQVVVIGTGSIGKCHAENIRLILPDAGIIFLRRNPVEDTLSKKLNARVVGTLDDALKTHPDCAVLATPSARHIDTLVPLIEAHIPVYIEKPVVTTREDVEQLQSHLNSTQYSAPNLVGCNFRFLPSLCKVREVIQSGNLGNIVRANLVVGQWLPDWRPQQDYRECYSAHSNMGGGVILDLIHEIDIARWLFGEFDQVRALSGKFSSLDITSEDTACILLGKSDGPPVVSLSMDYVSRRLVRQYEIVGEEGTLIWDLGQGLLEILGPQNADRIECGKSAFDVAETYRTAIKLFVESVTHKRPVSPDIKDGLKSVELALTAKEEGQR